MVSFKNFVLNWLFSPINISICLNYLNLLHLLYWFYLILKGQDINIAQIRFSSLFSYFVFLFEYIFANLVKSFQLKYFYIYDSLICTDRLIVAGSFIIDSEHHTNIRTHHITCLSLTYLIYVYLISVHLSVLITFGYKLLFIYCS